MSMSVFYRYVLPMLGWALVSGVAHAAPLSGLDLAKASQCMACHQVDTKRVGPPFRAVAQRFAGQPDASDYLVRVIRQGGRGQWGAIPMPAQNQISTFDAQRLAQWILSLQAPKD